MNSSSGGPEIPLPIGDKFNELLARATNILDITELSLLESYRCYIASGKRKHKEATKAQTEFYSQAFNGVVDTVIQRPQDSIDNKANELTTYLSGAYVNHKKLFASLDSQIESPDKEYSDRVRSDIEVRLLESYEDNDDPDNLRHAAIEIWSEMLNDDSLQIYELLEQSPKTKLRNLKREVFYHGSDVVKMGSAALLAIWLDRKISKH